MPVWEIIVAAFTALKANAMRSLLTMLGVVIGVASVIAMIALGNGAQNAVRERIAKLGTTVLQINPQRVNQGGINTTAVAKITMKDIEMMRERSHHVSGINAQQDRDLQVVWGNKNTSAQITGTSANFLEVRGFRMAAGRMFTEGEDAARRRVAVIGSEILPRLDNQILIPFSTGRFEIFGSDRIQDVWARAIDESSIDSVTAEISAALRRAHKLRYDQPDDFTIRNQSDFLVVLGESTRTFTQLLAGISLVSLIVGGIGIMNIMLVSVTERTREIGVRKALGATRSAILLQFLTEAVALCMAGGLLGVFAGSITSTVLRQAFGWDTALSSTAIALAFAFAAIVGIVFGVWPARRASLLDPIAALGYD